MTVTLQSAFDFVTSEASEGEFFEVSTFEEAFHLFANHMTDSRWFYSTTEGVLIVCSYRTFDDYNLHPDCGVQIVWTPKINIRQFLKEFFDV